MFAVAFNISQEALTGLVPWIVFLMTLALIFIAKRGMLTGMAGAAVLGVGLKLILSI
jgi:hypothetical protein